VTKDVPNFVVVAGNPARVVRTIEPKAPDPRLSEAEKSEVVVAAAERT
jgi:serine acetyltransferase